MASEQPAHPPPIAPDTTADTTADNDEAYPSPSPSPSTSPSTSPSQPSQAPSQAATAPAASGPPTDTRRCFICLGDEPESALPRDWVTPCGCALEGHQACLLDWISDLEAQGKEKKCSLCKAPIQLVERWSALEKLSQQLQRVLSDWSPTILLTFLGAGTAVGSAAYGFEAVEMFAGPEVAARFLFKERPVNPFPPELQRKVPFLSLDSGWLALKVLAATNFGSLCVLPLIGPALVLNRLLFLPRVLTVPVSLLLVGWNSLVDPKTQALTWPPTLQQAFTLLPAVQSSYFILYERFFGYLEKRWDALAKRPYTRDRENGALAPQGEVAADNADHDDDGDDDIAAGGNQNGLQIEVNGIGGQWTVNFLASALMWPGVCYGMGALMRLLLPRRLVARPARGPNTGILQERWGRSLVGGCLFVVLKDAFSLYVKYRRAMNRPHRRIKNVDRPKRK